MEDGVQYLSSVFDRGDLATVREQCVGFHKTYKRKFLNRGVLPGEYSDYTVDACSDQRVDFRYPVLAGDSVFVKLLAAAEKIIGPKVYLKQVRVFGTFPGCPQQTLHRDSGVFLDQKMYQVFIPLQDPEPGVGHTVFYPGTHLDEQALCGAKFYIEPRCGDALVFDQAILHHGTAHQGQNARYVLSLGYSTAQHFHDHTYDDTPMLLRDSDFTLSTEPRSRWERPRRGHVDYS